MKVGNESNIISDLFISYTDEGNENTIPIVFIHAFPLDKSMWKGQTEELRNKYRVITYDVRGYGDSEPGTEKLSIDLFASDLMRLLDMLNLPKAILCGLSMGGYIALRAMEKFPERFDALILSDTQCSADSAEAKEKRMKAIHSIRSEGLQPYADQLLSGFFFGDSTDARSKEMIEVRRIIEGNSVDVVCNTLQALAERSETCSNLSKIEVPVLILVGNEDPVTPPATAELMQSNIAGSTLYHLKNSAHLSNLDNPLDFNRHLNDFLELVIQKKL